LDTAWARFVEPSAHEPIVRARAAGSVALMFKHGANRSPENSHAVHHVAWLLGFIGIYTIGSFVHVLLVVAIVLFLVGLLSGRRVLG